MRRSTSKGLIQLILSILVYVLFHMYFFKVLSIFGINFTGNAYQIANLVRYLIITAIVVVIYNGEIRAGRNKFNKSLLNSIIYATSCFIFLMLITIGIHNLVNYVGRSSGIMIGYSFTNYFNYSFSMDLVFKIIEEVILIPFLLCLIFPLGFSNVIKGSFKASIVAALVYGILYAIGLNTTLQYALFYSITPALVVFSLTYLYKANGNIWSVYITYVLYVLCGTFALNYIMR